VTPTKPPTIPPPTAFSRVSDTFDDPVAPVAVGVDAVVEVAGTDVWLVIDETTLVDSADTVAGVGAIELVPDGIAVDAVRLTLFLAFV